MTASAATGAEVPTAAGALAGRSAVDRGGTVPTVFGIPSDIARKTCVVI